MKSNKTLKHLYKRGYKQFVQKYTKSLLKNLSTKKIAAYMLIGHARELVHVYNRGIKKYIGKGKQNYKNGEIYDEYIDLISNGREPKWRRLPMKEVCLSDDCPVKKQKDIRNVKTNSLKKSYLDACEEEWPDHVLFYCDFCICSHKEEINYIVKELCKLILISKG